MKICGQAVQWKLQKVDRFWVNKTSPFAFEAQFLHHCLDRDNTFRANEVQVAGFIFVRLKRGMAQGVVGHMTYLVGYVTY